MHLLRGRRDNDVVAGSGMHAVLDVAYDPLTDQLVIKLDDAPPTIESYADLLELPAGTVVQDADGNVWCVKKHQAETWLCPFSDEYAFIVRDGSTHAHGDEPALPITFTTLVSTEAG
jgi:hypothetical protein